MASLYTKSSGNASDTSLPNTFSHLLKRLKTAIDKIDDESAKKEIGSLYESLDGLLQTTQSRVGQEYPFGESYLQLAENGNTVANWIIHEFFNELSQVNAEDANASRSNLSPENGQVLKLSIALADGELPNSPPGLAQAPKQDQVILERALSRDIQQIILNGFPKNNGNRLNDHDINDNGTNNRLSSDFTSLAESSDNVMISNTNKNRMNNNGNNGNNSNKNKYLKELSEEPKIRRSLSKFGEFVCKIIQRGRVIDTMMREVTYRKAKIAFSNSTTDAIKHYLANNDNNWEMNIFEFEKICLQHNTCSLMALGSFFILPYCRTLKISSRKVLSFLLDLNSNYLSSSQVVYHNAVHGADVLFTSNYFLNCTFFCHCLKLSNLEKFAILIASAAHDVGHPGFNNTYQINTESELSQRYNDQSVLENYHTSLLFTLLKKKQNNFYQQLSKARQRHFRLIVIKLILGTDMKKHVSQVKTLNSLLNELHPFICQTNEILVENSILSESNQDIKQTPEESISIEIKPASSITASTVVASDIAHISENTKLELLEILLHLADISNPARQFKISEQWALLISEEFFRQGDTEKKRNIDVSPLCDRNNTKVGESQIGFITYVVAPLFDSWSKIVPEIAHCLETMEQCKKLWKSYQFDAQKYQQVLK